MNETAKHSFWTIWLPLGLAAAIFLLVTFIGNILVIGAKLGAIHKGLEWTLYGSGVAVIIWVIVVPLLTMLTAPVIALEDVVTGKCKADYRILRRVARQLIKSGMLPEDHLKRLAGAVGLGSDLREPLSAAISTQKESAIKIIREHAVLVFVSTAVSQNGRLDALTVLGTNFRLVRTLVRHFGYRPPLPVLIRIYAQIFIAALIANEIDDLDMENGIDQLGFGVVAAIPGASLVVNSLVDGTFNALLTLRIGFVARKCIVNAGAGLSRTEIRKAASREARQELKAVWKDAAPILPGVVKGFVQKLI